MKSDLIYYDFVTERELHTKLLFLYPKPMTLRFTKSLTIFHHVRIQYEPVRKAYALLSPEKVFWPNEIGLDILRLCDGTKTAHEIALSLSETYDAPVHEIIDDVYSFLQDWADQLVVKI